MTNRACCLLGCLQIVTSPTANCVFSRVHNQEGQSILFSCQWIGGREILQETNGKICGFRFRFSLKPIRCSWCSGWCVPFHIKTIPVPRETLGQKLYIGTNKNMVVPDEVYKPVSFLWCLNFGNTACHASSPGGAWHIDRQGRGIPVRGNSLKIGDVAICRGNTTSWMVYFMEDMIIPI